MNSNFVHPPNGSPVYEADCCNYNMYVPSFKDFEWDEAGEDRHISIGTVEPGALIVVAHTQRGRRIRLISARPASRKERKAYHERTR